MRALFFFGLTCFGLFALLLLLPIRVRVDGAFSLREMRIALKVSILHDFIAKRWVIPPLPKRKTAKKRISWKEGKSFLALVQQVLMRVRFWQSELHISLGTGDAAQTALLCGVLYALLGSVGRALLPRGRHGNGWQAQLWPNFDAPRSRPECQAPWAGRTAVLPCAHLPRGAPPTTQRRP